MHRTPTFYETLGLKSTAVISEIRLAHRKLAQQNHPDKVHHLAIEFPWVLQEAAHRFKRITEAFNVLKDDKARGRYDAELHKRRPEFVSLHASPIYDPGRYRQPATDTPGNASVFSTRAAEARVAQPAQAASLFHRYSIPTESPFRNFEPRAERGRKNVFVSALAFVAVLAVIYCAMHYQQLGQKTSDWLMQQQNNPNAAMQSAPVQTPAPAPAPHSKTLKK